MSVSKVPLPPCPLKEQLDFCCEVYLFEPENSECFMSAIQATVSLQAETEGQMPLQISVVQCNPSDHPQQAKHTWSFNAAGLPVEVTQYFKHAIFYEERQRITCNTNEVKHRGAPIKSDAH